MVAPTFNLTVMRPVVPLVVTQSGWINQTDLDKMLVDPQPGVKATTNTGQPYIVLDAGPVYRQVAFLYHNMDASAQWRLRCGSTAANTVAAPNYDSGWIGVSGGADAQMIARPSGYRHSFYQFPADRSDYLRIDWSWNAYITAGRLLKGPKVQPEFNADYGDTSWGYAEAEEGDFLDSGVEVLIERTPAPYFEFRLSWLTEAEMQADWEPLSRLAVEGTPVLVCRDPSATTYLHNGLFYGRLRLSPLVAADFDMYEVNGKIRSMV